MRIEVEQEDDGRWLADVLDLPGVMSYGETRERAVAKAEALALRVIADRLDHGEVIPELDDLFKDMIVARGKGFSITRSDLDKAIITAKATRAGQGNPMGPSESAELEGQLLNRMITTAMLLKKIITSKEPILTPETVILLDESSMADAISLHRLLTAAERVNAKIVAVVRLDG